MRRGEAHREGIDERETVAKDRRENPTLAAHVAEASGAEREIESSLAAHLLLVTRAQHHARLERHLEGSKTRVESLERRLKDLGGSARSVAKPSKPAKQVRGAAKTAEQRATKLASGSAKKVRDAAELRRVFEAASEEQQDALRQSATYTSLRALAKASDDKDTAKLAKRLREEHREWAKFLSDELKSLSKKLVKAEGEEREEAASSRRSAAAKRAASSRSRKGSSSSNGRKGSGSRARGSSSSSARTSSSSRARKSSPGARKPASRARGRSSTKSSSGSGGSRSGSSRSGSSRSGARRSTAKRSTAKRSTAKRS